MAASSFPESDRRIKLQALFRASFDAALPRLLVVRRVQRLPKHAGEMRQAWPRMGNRLNAARPPSLSHLEASRTVLGLAARARGAPFLARGVVSSLRKTSRAVIARTIIDGSTVDMRESSGVSDGRLARRLTGKATSWVCAEPVVLLLHAPVATKRTSPRQRCWTRHFVKTSTKSRPAYDESARQ